MTEQAEVLSAGDARARVAVLEAEIAELRKRVCVPEGHVVVPVEPSDGHLDSMAMRMRHDFGLLPEYLKERFRGDARQLYEECTGQGFYKLAAPAPVEQEGQEPAAWIRFRSDGCYEGPHRSIDDVRKRSGEWTPLYPASAPVEPSAVKDSLTAQPAAYAVFAENGNIRIWCADPVQAETLRAEYGHDLQPLYTTPQPAPAVARKAPPEDPLCGIEYRADGEANFYTLSAATGSWVARIQFNGRFYPHEQERILSAMLGDRNVRYGDGYYDGYWSARKESAAAQDVAGLPFVRKILEKLERFRECAEDDEGVDIGRNWLDMLTRLGLLNRVQRSPARWEMTAQADDALETAHQQREGE